MSKADWLLWLVVRALARINQRMLAEKTIGGVFADGHSMNRTSIMRFLIGKDPSKEDKVSKSKMEQSWCRRSRRRNIRL